MLGLGTGGESGDGESGGPTGRAEWLVLVKLFVLHVADSVSQQNRLATERSSSCNDVGDRNEATATMTTIAADAKTDDDDYDDDNDYDRRLTAHDRARFCCV